ncbi:MAG: adenosylcobinamide-GDP ribazoletransferase [Chloroflexota bacterium]
MGRVPCPRGFLAALRFLTIAPIDRGAVSPEELSAGLPYFPVVGLLLGLALAALDALLGLVLPPFPASALVVAAMVLLTGGLHLDGLADACDGLFGGHTPERRREIMRDTARGAYATAGIVLVLLVKWSALASLGGPVRPWAIVAAPVLGRWAQVLALTAFPYARAEGLGVAFKGGATAGRAVAAAFVAFGAAGLLLRAPGLWLAGVVTLAAWLLARWASARLGGGLTGDVYGALSEVTEALALTVAVAMAGTALVQVMVW